MALTAEQQAEIQLEIDKTVFRMNAESEAEINEKTAAADAARRKFESDLEGRRSRLDAVRLAKETLIENDRSKPADERGVSANDIITFATALNNYVNP